MNCEKCDKREATYNSPGKWCDGCWDNWWFEDYSPNQRAEDEPFIFVCRAFQNLEDNASDAEAMRYVMKACRGSVNPSQVREAIGLYREFQENPEKS